MMRLFIILLLSVFMLVGCKTTSIPERVSHQSAGVSSEAQMSTLDEQFYQQAQQAVEEGNFVKAISLYEHVINQHEDNAALRLEYAQLLRRASETKRAIAVYRNYLKRWPDNIDAKEGLGLSLMQGGDFDQAEILFESIIVHNASRWRTVNALGVIHALSGNMNEAKHYYQMAVTISQDNPAVLNNIGLSMALSGHPRRALDVMHKALSSLSLEKEKRTQIEMNLALIYGMRGELQEAKKILTKHLPESGVYNNLGFYARLTEDKRLAKTYLSKALAAHPMHYERAQKNLNLVQ